MIPTTHVPRTILVVEDDREVQRAVSERLEREGWRVICERDGDWALRSFERRQVDAVVLDILLPVVSGLQVAEKIRSLPRGQEVGILMLTGVYRGPRLRAEAIEKYRLIDYLDKPVELERVVELLSFFFSKRDEVRALSEPPLAQVDAAQLKEKRQVERAVEKAEASPDADLRGNLRRITFPRLLERLHAQRLTGALFLLRGKLKKIVYVREGRPTYVKSNVLSECLGRVLIRERIITEQECEESVVRMKKEKRQQGAILVEMGVISPHNLEFGLERQLQIKLWDIFSWLEGEYVFRKDVPQPETPITLTLSHMHVVLEGVRRTYEDSRLRALLAPVMTQYLVPADRADVTWPALGLTAAEAGLLAGIDGSATVSEVLGHATPPSFGHDAMALLYALCVCEVLATQSKAVAKARPRWTVKELLGA
jgi:DNA-binding response OmpR family regulator